ncbi:ornithine carbamoyltransferase [Staphylococcus gallinarum]|uniref:Ornithine carbamoyltransferase n=2 Tax=Staphylococcus gallinarum TaxID=1293 RepID=A0A2T4T033_STAGA|nr:ornithine carbamoyltransferase [Staphylococcus gallinarum]MBU7217222.1 ornithine carbamoyltransferase [Staphylococcus gallinarum]MCD8785353.1 ornithine carbamoyltransferase [Staphylococcus gallinarum]MCD8792372.1 ornithine carbamoyltransferase [Staphylococcus gallinarum]MCD8822187.1 ornithine carbamoyltransferase [Staphylococcus gallinarum]MCD8827599.1 ornithine carbamoyltransferase [Staphylococcus gallinarum]
MGAYTTALKKLQSFKGKHFLKTCDFSADELNTLVDFTGELKEKKKRGIPHPYLKGKNLALLFEKPSTRTRSAFSVAAYDLGAYPEYFGQGDIHLGVKESTADTAKVLGRMYDGIEFRGFHQKDVESLAENANVPVWNGLTNEWHPTQMIADFFTLKENLGTLSGKTLTYVGDARNNVAHDLLVTGAILGVNVHIAAPVSLQPDESIQEMAQAYAEQSGSHILITEDVKQAIYQTDAIYTDVWFSMGEDQSVLETRINQLLPYQVNESMLLQTMNPDVIVLHCLPAFHDLNTEVSQQIYETYGLTEMEMTDDVFQGKHSVVFDQAENRLHSIKAIMSVTLGDIF